MITDKKCATYGNYVQLTEEPTTKHYSVLAEQMAKTMETLVKEGWAIVEAKFIHKTRDEFLQFEPLPDGVIGTLAWCIHCERS